jgi:tRNA dimethylallyltransferase
MSSPNLFDVDRAPAHAGAVCLAGPTAAGKTAVALALAAHLKAQAQPRQLEVVSVDSALVYRGMDIGTAKPSAAERALVPHHLVDLIEPSQSYSAARFVVDAQQAIEQIRQRGNVPLLVGGTMLYFKALREGLHDMPGANAEVRAALELEASTRGWPAMHADLALVDPQTAARLAPLDAQRIQRALEVWRCTGRSLSSWHSSGLSKPATGAEQWPVLSLEPAMRPWLHERIALRCQAMVQAGLLQEVQSLRARGDLNLGLPAMRCVGYRQVWQALDAGQAEPASWLDSTVFATRQLAKRQLTWLRGISAREVVACDGEEAVQHAVHALHRLLQIQGDVAS